MEDISPVSDVIAVLFELVPAGGSEARDEAECEGVQGEGGHELEGFRVRLHHVLHGLYLWVKDIPDSRRRCRTNCADLICSAPFCLDSI